MTGWGISIFFGPGHVVHWSTEDGWQYERAEHRTWRLGFLAAVRREQPQPLRPPPYTMADAQEALRRAAQLPTAAEFGERLARTFPSGRPTMMCPTPENAPKPERTAPSGWSQYDWDVYNGNIRDPLG